MNFLYPPHVHQVFTKYFARRYWGNVKNVNLKNLVGASTKIGGRLTNQDRFTYSLLNLPTNGESNTCICHTSSPSAPHSTRVLLPEITPVNPNTFLSVGVFDGHNGHVVADYLSRNLHLHLDNIDSKSLDARLFQVFNEMEVELKDLASREEIKTFSGSTAVVALMGVNSYDLVVANLGDCQALLSHRGRSVPLSSLHSTSNPKERARVIKEGGNIVTDTYGGLRVNCSTNVTRSFGASSWLNTGVSSLPEIKHYQLSKGDEDCFFVLGSDGIFNNLTRQHVVDIVKGCKTPQEAAELLTTYATIQGSCFDDNDNATAIVVRLKGWGKYTSHHYTNELKNKNLDTLFGMLFEPDDRILDLLDANADVMDFLEYVYYDLFDVNGKGLTLDDIEQGMSRMDKYIPSENASISLGARDIDGNKTLSFEEFCSFAKSPQTIRN